MPALGGRAVWTQFTKCICLDYSHRCRGDLADIIATLRTAKRTFRAAVASLAKPRAAQRRCASSPQKICCAYRRPWRPCHVRAALTPARAHALAARGGAFAFCRRQTLSAVMTACWREILPLRIDVFLCTASALPKSSLVPLPWLGCKLLLEEKLCDLKLAASRLSMSFQVKGRSHGSSLSPFVLILPRLVVRVPGAHGSKTLRWGLVRSSLAPEKVVALWPRS